MALLPSPRYAKCCDITLTDTDESTESLLLLKPRVTFPDTLFDIFAEEGIDLFDDSSKVTNEDPGFTRIP